MSRGCCGAAEKGKHTDNNYNPISYTFYLCFILYLYSLLYSIFFIPNPIYYIVLIVNIQIYKGFEENTTERQVHNIRKHRARSFPSHPLLFPSSLAGFNDHLLMSRVWERRDFSLWRKMEWNNKQQYNPVSISLYIYLFYPISPLYYSIPLSV